MLSLACAGGHLAVVELLLAHGADPLHKLKVRFDRGFHFLLPTYKENEDDFQRKFMQYNRKNKVTKKPHTV